MRVRMIDRIVCWLYGHKRHPNAPWYWHSCEQCERCKRLVDSPMVEPLIWEPATWEKP